MEAPRGSRIPAGHTSLWRSAVFVAFCFLGTPLLYAQSSQPLLAQPSTIAAPSAGFTATAHIALLNSGEHPFEQVSLSSFGNDGIVSVIGKPASATVPPKGVIDWPVSLTVPSSAHLPGSVIFEASYRTAGVPAVLFTTISFTADIAQKLVDATLDGTPDPISQQRPGNLYLIVTNNLNVTAKASAQPHKPSAGLEISAVGTFEIPPRSTAARRIELSTAGRVTPGSQDAAIDVDIHWERDGQTDRRYFALTKTITVGVFFESELLKALGVPSFLLLPGCIVIFTLLALLNTGWLGVKNHSSLPSLNNTQPVFWIIVLPLSGFLLLLYYWITGINCLLNYGVIDIGYLWGSGFVLGCIWFLLYAAWIKYHFVTSADTPLQVLEKLARNGLSLERPAWEFKVNGNDVTGLALEDTDDNPAQFWVSPKVKVTWGAGAGAQQQQYNGLLNNKRGPRELVRLLHQPDLDVKLEFEGGDLTGPLHLKTDANTQPKARQLIVD